MDDHITSLANHFFFSSLKKDSDAIEELSRNIARKNQDETCEFLCILGGIISGHIEYSDTTEPNLIISAESDIETALGVSISTLITRRNAAVGHQYPDV